MKEHNLESYLVIMPPNRNMSSWFLLGAEIDLPVGPTDFEFLHIFAIRRRKEEPFSDKLWFYLKSMRTDRGQLDGLKFFTGLGIKIFVP
jgi:hypothetical protein